jgi:hypothetical protein
VILQYVYITAAGEKLEKANVGEIGTRKVCKCKNQDNDDRVTTER